MKKLIFFMAIGFIGLTVNSCKDDTQAPSQKELLTGSTWKIISKAISPSFEMGGITITDISVLESDEVRGYSYVYNSDGTVAQYDKSNQFVSQTSWALNADETQIIYNPSIKYTYPVVGDIGLSTITIISIGANEMVTTVPYLYQGTNYVITITFVPK